MEKRGVIIARVMGRLLERREVERGRQRKSPYGSVEDKERLDSAVIDRFVSGLKRVYQRHRRSVFEDEAFPRDVLRFVGDFMDMNRPNREDKIKLLGEAKKNKLFDFKLNKNLERAWRVILKNWDLRNYRLEG